MRKLTLGGAEAIPPASRDDVYIGPGVYREILTCGVSGGNLYNAGTVTVTNGSTTVTGAGTAFVANVAAGDMFHVQFFASGADGVANGTATFTSAAGNFQANMVGKVIQINTRGAYVIGAVVLATQITLTDPSALGWPAAGAGLNYSVMAGEGPYEIDSVTDNTNFELVRPWCGPTLTGLAYVTYGAIRFIGDVTGQMTDGIGGIVRITGSDGDCTGWRNTGIDINGQDYRLFRGIRIDMQDAACISWGTGEHNTLEDCHLLETFYGASLLAVNLAVANQNGTIRRCFMGPAAGWHAIVIWNNVTADNSGFVIENCVFVGCQPWGSSVLSQRIGGIVVRNCTFLGCYRCIEVQFALTVGQTIDVRNCIIEGTTLGMTATAVGEITENYNTVASAATDRQNTAVGANSAWCNAVVTSPILYPGEGQNSGFKFPWWFSELSQWSQLTRAGAFEACEDMRACRRPGTSAKKSWGALQHADMERDTGTVYAGTASMEISDAGRVQFKVPCTNRSYMVRVRVYREANYAGTNPQLVVKQPGQADRTTVDAGAAGAWNLLEDTFTPAVDPEYFFVELVSNNTAVAGNYATYFDNLEIRGEPQDPGEFEHWMWDRQPFDTLPAEALVVRGREYRRRRMPGEVSAMEEQ